jgi:heme A synthase
VLRSARCDDAHPTPVVIWEASMYALALLVIGLSGYVAFAKTREGADLARSVCESMLVAALFGALLGGATLWLSGAPSAEVADLSLTILGLAFAAALLGAVWASSRGRRAPLPQW